MGRSTRLWVGALLVGAAGCGRSGVPVSDLSSLDGAEIPFPEGLPGSPEIQGPSFDTGRGIDGPIVFDASLTELSDCAVVVSAQGDTLELGTVSPPFDAGRRVVIVQMNDTLVDESESGPSKTVTDFKRAGEWEIAELVDRIGAFATVAQPLKIHYETDIVDGYRAQACLVHEWTDVTITPGSTVQPEEWNGVTGGVFAAQISGTLFVDAGATLSASASGFRGGICGATSNASNVSGYDVQDGSGGGKGEGLDARWFYVKFGRGAVANAGGGGNGLNAGGGGGGGAGRGGDGGRQRGTTTSAISGDGTTQGIPGGAAADAMRLVMGGGGGSGHLDHFELESCGGAGGGAIVLRTAALAGAGTIAADGAGGVQLERNGAGGGGAGGTIDLLTANSALFGGRITADGGEGGDVTAGFISTITYGPGGGGGGGHVRVTGVTAAYGLSAKGGINGTNEQNGLSSGAQDGIDGLVTIH